MKVTDNNKTQNRLSACNHYAYKSLILGIIGLILPLALLLSLGLLCTSDFFSVEMLNYIILGVIIAYLAISILGIIFGKKGLRSDKPGISKAGLIVSSIGLGIPTIVTIIAIIYVLLGGEFM